MKRSSSNANPIKRARTQLNLTQQQLAIRAGCSKQLIVRTEQGCFTDPPLIIVEYLTSVGYDPDDLLDDYKEFQTETRQESGKFLGNKFYFDHDEHTKHPLLVLRTRVKPALNLTQVCKMLCISQATLYRFENSPRQQQTVPSELIIALMDCGYSDSDIDYLIKEYSNYRKHLPTITRVS